MTENEENGEQGDNRDRERGEGSDQEGQEGSRRARDVGEEDRWSGRQRGRLGREIRARREAWQAGQRQVEGSNSTPTGNGGRGKARGRQVQAPGGPTRRDGGPRAEGEVPGRELGRRSSRPEDAGT